MITQFFTLPIRYTLGGTGLNSLGTAGQVLKTNPGVTGIEWGAGGGSIVVADITDLGANVAGALTSAANASGGLVKFGGSAGALTVATLNGNTIVAGSGTLSLQNSSINITGGGNTLTLGGNLTATGNGIILNATGGSSDVTLPISGTLLAGITAVATLSFPLVAAGDYSEATSPINLTGAVVGDVVSIGLPIGYPSYNGVYSGYVILADEVRIRFTNTNLVTAIQPGGDFRATIIKP